MFVLLWYMYVPLAHWSFGIKDGVMVLCAKVPSDRITMTAFIAFH